tara:strand:+ start:9253 stop:9417 length:165 start_codon:yes stop_codon:yes gene_type:complete
MDFLIGFVVGYCIKYVMSYLKDLAENLEFDNKYKTIVDLDKEWDWISYKEDDLP